MDRKELEQRLAAEFDEVGLRAVSRQARDLADSGRVAEDLRFEVTVETVVSNLADAPEGGEALLDPLIRDGEVVREFDLDRATERCLGDADAVLRD